jgi:hypothetical protein
MSFEIDKVYKDFLGFRVIRCLISINKSIFRSFMVIGRVTRHYRSRYEFLLGVRLENFWVLTKSLGWVLISLVLGAVWSENVTSPSRKCFQTLICTREHANCYECIDWSYACLSFLWCVCTWFTIRNLLRMFVNAKYFLPYLGKYQDTPLYVKFTV